jgi:TetR/AcrR family transcriptional regulator, regulator of cefoperazone and chloramphenicol sensitivity
MANVKNNASAQETRRRLIDAAGGVFAEVGFHGATVRQITERAGVNLAAVNYHFCDKAELYAAVLDEAHCKARERDPAPPPDDLSKGTPADRLHAFVRRFLLRLLDPSRPAWHGRLMCR